jgi:hypothetical protein
MVAAVMSSGGCAPRAGDPERDNLGRARTAVESAKGREPPRSELRAGMASRTRHVVRTRAISKAGANAGADVDEAVRPRRRGLT